jgi:NTE family protein
MSTFERNEEIKEEWKPDVLILGPGGSRGFLEIGALKKLFENDFLKNVTKWVGISVGAAIALLIVAGYTIEEIIDICIGVNILEDILTINLNDLTKKLGLIKIKSIEKKLKHYVSLKFGLIPTLKQLYEFTNLDLFLVTFNFDKMRPEFLNKDSEPELSCVEATMMSMSIPILFQPRKYKGDFFIDGAIGAPYPISNFDQNGNKILGIFICSNDEIFNIENPINYLYRLIHSSMKVLRDMEIKNASSNVKHIILKTLIKDTTGLSINEESRHFMINMGYQTADEFIRVNSDPEKYKIVLSENEEIPFN